MDFGKAYLNITKTFENWSICAHNDGDSERWITLKPKSLPRSITRIKVKYRLKVMDGDGNEINVSGTQFVDKYGAYIESWDDSKFVIQSGLEIKLKVNVVLIFCGAEAMERDQWAKYGFI